jgi:spore maturation protein CgeB
MGKETRTLAIIFPYASSTLNQHTSYLKGMIKAFSRWGFTIRLFCPEHLGTYCRHHFVFNDQLSAYDLRDEYSLIRTLDDAIGADILFKIEGTSFTDLLIQASLQQMNFFNKLVIFWSLSELPVPAEKIVRAPVEERTFEGYDLVITNNSDRNVRRYFTNEGASACFVLSTAVDSQEFLNFRKDGELSFDMTVFADAAGLTFERLEEMVLKPASIASHKKICLVGERWKNVPLPQNVSLFSEQGEDLSGQILPLSKTCFVFYDSSNESKSQEILLKAAASGAAVFTDKGCIGDNFFRVGEEIILIQDASAFERSLSKISPMVLSEMAGNAYRRVIDNHTFNHRIYHLVKVLNRLLKEKSVKP